MPTSPRLDERLDQIIRRGYRLRRRRRMIPVGGAAVAAVAALIAIGAQTSSQTVRVHTIEPADTPTTTILARPSASVPSHDGAASPNLGARTSSPATTAAPRNQPSGAVAPTADASPQAGPGSTGTAYTYVQICSQPTVGPFGGPTSPPYCWTPSTLNIHVGWTVTFDGTRAFGGTVTYHTVTSTSSNWNVDAKVYSNPNYGPGQFSYTFTKPGTYTFYDKNQGGNGAVVVSQ